MRGMAPDHDSRPLSPAPSATAFVGPADDGPVGTPVEVASLEDYRATFWPAGSAPSTLDHAVGLFFANGGTDAVVVRSAGPTPDQLVPVDGAGGLRAVPGPFSVLVLAGVTTDHPLAVARALDRCEQERAVLLLDLPAGADADSALLGTARVGGLRSRATAYLPWVGVATDDGLVQVPPSGAVAGLLSRAAASEGVWSVPTGPDAELAGVAGPTAAVDDAVAERLAAGGVNVLRAVPGRPPRPWGARTLAARDSAEPAERYLAVRRLTDHVLASLEDGMAFVSGRRADPGLGDLVRRRAEDFLDDLWRRGALAGDRPQDAYFARCDRTTTTAADLAAGRIVLLVGLAALRPGEFEVHRLDLDTVAAEGPPVLPANAAVAAATRLATERLTVVRRVDLRPLVTADPEATEQLLAREFAAAASGRTVLLLQDADGVLAADARDGVRTARRPGQVRRLLERLSRDTGVPYLLGARREEANGGRSQPTGTGAPGSRPGTDSRARSSPSAGRA